MIKGAMTLAEGSQLKKFKTNADLVLNGIKQRQYVLRTTYDSLPVWKSKYAVNTSPFYPRLKTTIKEAALIDNEIWVFGVDGTKCQNLIEAVNVATEFYRVQPKDILSDIYIKNLNAEGGHEDNLPFLVKLNMQLYQSTTEAIINTCNHFAINSEINLYVYSKNTNPKIPMAELHESLKLGGASSVVTDTRKIKTVAGNNEGTAELAMFSNLHIAKLGSR